MYSDCIRPLKNNKYLFMKKIIFGFLVVLSQVAYSQTSKNFGDFSAVKVYDRINVTLVKSNENKIQVKGDDPDVEIVNKNGELKIRMIPTKLMQGDKAEVTVFYEDINEIQASQGSKITSDGTIDSKMLSITSNEGSTLNLQVDVNLLNSKANSGGIINVSGTAEIQDVLVNSGAQFYGRDLDSETVTITANAGGFAEVNASKILNATTRAGGNIDVYGSPKDRNTKNVLGGKITFK